MYLSLVVQINGIEPKFESRPKLSGPISVGDEVTIRCEIKADPSPDIKWKIGGKEIFADEGNYKLSKIEKLDQISEYTIKIKSAQLSDAGKAEV